MAATRMRPFTNIRAGHTLSIRRASPMSLAASPPSRWFSLRRPLVLPYNQAHPNHQTIPTLSHLHLKTVFSSGPSRRHFSITPLVTSAISSAETVLTTLHSVTATPWYITIPLFALTLNLLTRLPAVIYSRRVAVRRAQLQLQPLARAYAVRLRNELIRDMLEERNANTGSNQRPSPATWEKRKGLLLKTNMRETVRRNKRWGVQKWKDWMPSLMVFPFWMVGIEALRRMCGGPRGLLGTFVLGPPKKPEADGAVAPEGSSGGGGGTGGVEGQVQEVVHSEVDLSSLATEQADVQETLASAVSGVNADTSMATGGCLWFPDLMVADPYHILPLALSAILVMNLVPKTRVGLRALLNMDDKPEVTTGTSKWRLRMHRGFLVVATSAGFLTMDLPAALHLYWVTSATLTWAQTSIVWKLMPLPKQVPPAKQQEWPIVPPQPKEPERAARKNV